MVTLSVTCSRIAGVLDRAADLLEADGWDPYMSPIIRAIDTAAGYVTPGVDRAAEDTTLQAFDALCRFVQSPASTWEKIPGLTLADVADALRGAAKEVTA